MSYYKSSCPFVDALDDASAAGKSTLLVCNELIDQSAAETLQFPNSSVIRIPLTQWHRSYGEFFGGFDIVLLPRNTPKGKKFAERFTEDTQKYCANVKTAFLSDEVDGGILQWVAEGKGTTELIDFLFRQEDEEDGKNSPALIDADSVPYSPPKWLIAPYFQRGKCTMIQGDNGTGKTAFACAVAACVSAGIPLYESPVETPGNVLILSVEDDLPVLRGRLEADGADLKKCKFLTNTAGLTFTSPEIEDAIRKTNARFVLFDPMQAFIGAKVDMHRSNETRPILSALNDLAEKYDCSICIIAHAVKNRGDRSPVNLALGSVDIPAAMRSIFHVIQSPEVDTDRIVIHVKSSNAPYGRSLVYEIGDRGGVRWVGYSSLTRNDLSWVEKRKEKEKVGIDYEREPLVQVFRQFITDNPGGGFISYADLKAEGMKILGFPPFKGVADLRAKLDSDFSRELQSKDGIIVTCGAKGVGNVRGVRIELYEVPAAYQGKLTV